MRIDIDRKYKYNLCVRFWDGFHLSSKGLFCEETDIAVVEAFFEREGTREEDLSIYDFAKIKGFSFGEVIHLISSHFAKASYEKSCESVVAYKIELIGDKNLLEFRGQLKENRQRLRGLPEGAMIVCSEKGSIKATECVGGTSARMESYLSYPDAIYKDADICDLLVDAGKPVEAYKTIRGQASYPAIFQVVGNAKHKVPKELWFAVRYKTRGLNREEIKILRANSTTPRFGFGMC